MLQPGASAGDPGKDHRSPKGRGCRRCFFKRYISEKVFYLYHFTIWITGNSYFISILLSFHMHFVKIYHYHYHYHHFKSFYIIWTWEMTPLRHVSWWVLTPGSSFPWWYSDTPTPKRKTLGKLWKTYEKPLENLWKTYGTLFHHWVNLRVYPAIFFPPLIVVT